MNVYEPDSDHFSKEYLDYLGTLDCAVGKVGEFPTRITTNPKGEIVRIEVWTTPNKADEAYGYFNFCLPGWMNP